MSSGLASQLMHIVLIHSVNPQWRPRNPKFQAWKFPGEEITDGCGEFKDLESPLRSLGLPKYSLMLPQTTNSLGPRCSVNRGSCSSLCKQSCTVSNFRAGCPGAGPSQVDNRPGWAQTHHTVVSQTLVSVFHNRCMNQTKEVWF